ncbi:polyphosphate kinase 1 [Fournierella massiliensis]|nr:polyphosphate kinase 1 [Fournierella massiliensis]MCF2557537.1 polyphosphate kinase 1 [Fournierella massiliensis]
MENENTANAMLCYENRELSWLKFNERVLQEAMDETVPLCERLSFLSIFQSNLDEFFMVRVGSLVDQALVSPTQRDNKTGMTASQQLSAVFEATRGLVRARDTVYTTLMAQLRQKGVEVISYQEAAPREADWLMRYFQENLLPLLSPQVIGKKQPFPFLRNKEIYAVAVLGSAKGGTKLGIVPCSGGAFGRLVAVPDHPGRFMLTEELILHFMPLIFKKYPILSKSLIRIVRNADIDVDTAFYDEDIDYRDKMEKLIRTRRKLCPVKLTCSRSLDDTAVKKLCRALDIKSGQVFWSQSPLEASFLSRLSDYLRGDRSLFYQRRSPQQPPWVVKGKGMMELIEEKDRLLSYPFESILPFIDLLRQAGRDDRVVSIKMTLYRVARNSQIVEALIDAAENGKEVVVLVELRARFDEENNIEWSRRMEEAGCRIVYGLDFVKVHSKLCLITYRDEDQAALGESVRFITQVGTGNYNENTAKLYTDLSLMTANKEIGLEADKVFKSLCMDQFVEDSRWLWVAPKCLQNRVLESIDGQIQRAREGKPAYVGVKINSLTDKTIMDKLIQASQAGVKVDLIVRGICCLIPGVEGYTENITVISIVGRYLEHSRIYIFGCPGEDEIYIASADYMTRNTCKRVEVAAPLLDEEIKARVRGMFETMLKDNQKARMLQSDKNYVYRRDEGEPLNSQEYFFEQAYRAAGKE